MQFEPGTFAQYDQPVPPGGAKTPSPYDPTDAVDAAARLLCDKGARNGTDLPRAIFAYNHASWYVTEVLRLAGRLAQEPSTGAAPPAVLAAVDYAISQLGTPYQWGGDSQGLASTAPVLFKLRVVQLASSSLASPRRSTTPVPTSPRRTTSAQGSRLLRRQHDSSKPRWHRHRSVLRDDRCPSYRCRRTLRTVPSHSRRAVGIGLLPRSDPPRMKEQALRGSPLCRRRTS
jgi:hypothetical protein